MSPARQQKLYHLRSLVAGLWLALLVFVLIRWWQCDLTLAEVPTRLEEWLRNFGLGRAGLFYMVLYAIRPLILFPATLLTMVSGLLFGPWLGVLFTIIGENASANFAFLLARWLGRDWVARNASSGLRHWDTRLEQNGLVAVLLMRLLFLPFDAVNFGCGLTAVRQRDFSLGTFLGILPSLIGFVLLGGVVSSRTSHPLAILSLSAGFLALGLLLAKRLRNQAPTATTADKSLVK